MNSGKRFLFGLGMPVLLFILLASSVDALADSYPQYSEQASQSVWHQTKDLQLDQEGNVATLQDYWDGNASFVFQYTMPIGIDSGGIVVLDGVWYAFSRMSNPAARPSYCSADWLQLGVSRSADQGRTWSAWVVAVDNVPNTPYECANPDSGPYYDFETNTWHILFQCLARSGGWNICHATRAGRDPMGPFTVDTNNPVINSGDLWRRICDKGTDDCKTLSPGGVWDEGTPDILKKVSGEYIVSFHGYDGVKGYRGIASTSDFVNWKIGNEAAIPLAEDALFDKKAADLIEENGYYYMFIEAPDKNLGCQPNSKWDFGVLRSNSLANTTWAQKNTASVYSQFLTGGCNGVAYQKLFIDGAGQIYMIFLRYDGIWHEFLLKLEKSDDLAFYQFREGSGDTTRSDLVRFGKYDARVHNVAWQTTGDYDSRLLFNGENSSVEFPGHSEYNRTETVFMEIKANISSAPSGKSALLAGKIGSYWAEIYSSALCFWVYSQTKGNVNTCVPLDDLIGIENTYQFLYDGSTLKIGINGSQRSSNNIGYSKIVSSAINFRMGGPYASTENYYGSFNGSVEYLRIARNGSIDTTTTTTTTTTSSSTTSSTTTTSTSTPTTTSSTTSTTILQCAMPGNYPDENGSCDEVTLSEIVNAINKWAVDAFQLADVVNLINSWADPIRYPSY
jgi:hypothetical protein